MKLAVIFLIMSLLIFALSYHFIDLSFNAKYGTVDIGNNLDPIQMHMVGMQLLFMSAILFSLAFWRAFIE